MATTLKIVAGNTAPAWQVTCQRAGASINLTGCTVHLIIANGKTITNEGALATIMNAAGGVITYAPLETDCPTAGSYKVDVKVTYADESYEVLYDQLKIKTRAPIVPAV